MPPRNTDRARQRSQTAQEVRELIAASGRTQGDIAAYLNRRLNTDEYQHYHISRMTSGDRKVTAQEIDALRELAAQPVGEPPAAAQLTETEDVVPLFGYANASGATLRLNEDQRVGVVPIHPAQRGSKRAFAFIVFGDSMSERLNHGDIGYALRNWPPAKEKPALIELVTGEALVKIYTGQDEHTLFAKQLKPPKTLSFPLKDVAAIHAVVGSSFGAG